MSGVAMGTKMGPSYACLFMGHLEEEALRSYNKPTPELFKRYIDDGLGATSLTHSELTDFISYIDNFHPAIKFTYDISDTSITFLDLQIELHQGQLSTTIHYKPTDSHSYLDYNSSHNPSTKNSIPFSQFLRLRRICSDNSDFNTKAEEMTQFFAKRNYPTAITNQALARIHQTNRADTLKSKPDKLPDERPILTLPYHPTVIPVKKILLSNWHLLQSHPDIANTFCSPPLVAYKRDQNLRDILVRAKLKTHTQSPPPGTTPCNQPKCKTCPFICNATSVTAPKSSMTIFKHFNCQTHNIIYLISCSRCNKLYVGETGRTLSTRFREHLDNIRFHRDKPVANHFNQTNHSIHDIRVKGLWIMLAGTTNDRKDRESHLIDRLGTQAPLGLNLKP